MAPAVPGKAWACQGCWRLYTSRCAVGRFHRKTTGSRRCLGGANYNTEPLEVSVDHQGVVVSGLPPGVQARNIPGDSCWAASPASSSVAATSVAVVSSSLGARLGYTQPPPVDTSSLDPWLGRSYNLKPPPTEKELAAESLIKLSRQDARLEAAEALITLSREAIKFD